MKVNKRMLLLCKCHPTTYRSRDESEHENTSIAKEVIIKCTATKKIWKVLYLVFYSDTCNKALYMCVRGTFVSEGFSTFNKCGVVN